MSRYAGKLMLQHVGDVYNKTNEDVKYCLATGKKGKLNIIIAMVFVIFAALLGGTVTMSIPT